MMKGEVVRKTFFKASAATLVAGLTIAVTSGTAFGADASVTSYASSKGAVENSTLDAAARVMANELATSGFGGIDCPSLKAAGAACIPFQTTDVRTEFSASAAAAAVQFTNAEGAGWVWGAGEATSSANVTYVVVVFANTNTTPATVSQPTTAPAHVPSTTVPKTTVTVPAPAPVVHPAAPVVHAAKPTVTVPKTKVVPTPTATSDHSTSFNATGIIEVGLLALAIFFGLARRRSPKSTPKHARTR